MNIRAGLWLVLAFCTALVAGHLFFKQISPQTKPVTHLAPSTGLLAPMLIASTPPSALPALAANKISQAQKIDRELKVGEGCVINENIRMKHWFSSDYAGGSMLQMPGYFSAATRWIPQKQELWHEQDVIAVLGQAKSLGARLEKNNKGNRIVYPGTYNETDERMYIRPDGGVEHDIIVKQPPLTLNEAEDLVYSGCLQLSTGLTLWDGKHQITGSYTTKNAVQIKNAFGHAIIELRKPFAWDAQLSADDGSLDYMKLLSKTEYQKCATECRYHFEFDQSGVKLAVVTPGKWLTDSKRAYPVTIDPNEGPLGLADGNPPQYIATASTGTLIPAIGGVKVLMLGQCPLTQTMNFGFVPIPFPFLYYGQQISILEVHESGFARPIAPLDCNVNNPLCYPQPCQYMNDLPNTALPHSGYPSDPAAFFVYWANIEFGPGPTPGGPDLSADPGSAIYYFVNGVEPNRQLIVEWHKMTFVNGQSTDLINFELILNECTNTFEYIIGQPGDVDENMATVGEQSSGGAMNSSAGAYYIQYCFDGGALSPAQPPITDGTAITFIPATANQITETPTLAAGCIPLTVCFNTVVTPPANNCGTAAINAVSPSYGFHWDFGDGTSIPTIDGVSLPGSQAFTSSVCHTFITPGVYQVQFSITDQDNITTTEPVIPVDVCDKPTVVIGATPQGGYAPLQVTLEARTSDTTNLSPTGNNNAAQWVINLLGSDDQPGQYQQIDSYVTNPLLSANVVNYTFYQPGTYQVTATFSATDIPTNLNTSNTGTVFIFVMDPNQTNTSATFITESTFKINWASKVPSALSSVTTQPTPANPNQDTLSVKGLISLPGITDSALAGLEVQLILNGVDIVFDSILDGSGTAVQGDAATGQTGFFNIKLPSGQFVCNVKGDLYSAFGLADVTEQELLAAQFHLSIQGLFPPPSCPDPIITYKYQSTAYKSATGVYKLGQLTNPAALGGGPNSPTYTLPGGTSYQNFGVAPGTGRIGGLETLVSGGFIVTNAALKLEGDWVYADISGLMARPGGDSLLPQASSDVVVSLGNFSQTLNFGATPTFKTIGKAPRQKVTFKSGKGLGANGVSNMQWVNHAGAFRIKTFGLPLEQVGLNPDVAVQALTLGLTITPANEQPFTVHAAFEVDKQSVKNFNLRRK